MSPARSALLNPSTLDELFLFRLTRLLATGGAPVVRLCEGRYSITRREWRLIAALAQNGSMLSSALARAIHLDRGRTSKAISELSRKGVVARTTRPSDRRKVDVALTESGFRIYNALFPAVVQQNKDLLAVLTPTEVDQLDDFLARIQARADALLDGAVLPKARRGQRN